jgi:hypothetical protein
MNYGRNAAHFVTQFIQQRIVPLAICCQTSNTSDILNRVRKSCVRMDKPNTDTKTCAYRRIKKNGKYNMISYTPSHSEYLLKCA